LIDDSLRHFYSLNSRFFPPSIPLHPYQRQFDMTSFLPFDLLYAVLDTVDDKKTLASCCFVSKMLLDVAQFLHHRSLDVTIRGTQGWRGFRHGCGTGRNLRGLRGILSISSVPRNAETTPSPETLCAQLQSLRVEDDGRARFPLHRSPSNLLSANSPTTPSFEERHPLQATLSQ